MRHISNATPCLVCSQGFPLSCLYALLDASDTITPEHLDAAVAVWRYCDASAAYIFGDMLGNPLADELLRMIRMAGQNGITRTEMSNTLGRNVKSAVIGHALSLLLRDHLVSARQTRAEEKGRQTSQGFCGLQPLALGTLSVIRPA